MGGYGEMAAKADKLAVRTINRRLHGERFPSLGFIIGDAHDQSAPTECADEFVKL